MDQTIRWKKWGEITRESKHNQNFSLNTKERVWKSTLGRISEKFFASPPPPTESLFKIDSLCFNEQKLY